MLPNNKNSYLNNISVASLLGVGCVFFIVFCYVTYLHFLLFLSSVPIFYAGLVYGVKENLIAMMVSIIVSFLFFQSSIFWMDLTLTVIIPAAIVGNFVLLHKKQSDKIWWCPENYILYRLSFYIFLLAIVLSTCIYSESFIKESMTEILNILSKNNNSFGHAFNYMNKIVHLAVGMEILFKMFMLMFSFQIAEKIAFIKKVDIRPALKVENVHIDAFNATIPLLFLTLSIFFKEYSFVLCSIGIGMLFPVLINGMSVVKLFGRARNVKNIMVFFYVLLLLFPYIIVAVIFLGIIDSFVKLRVRLNK